MGPTLEETRRDLRYMPTQYLTQVVQTPNDRVIGDIPLKTLAGLELSRRAQMQNELAAMNAPNPQMPTVMDSTLQSLNPQPQQGMPPQGMPPQGMPPQGPPQGMPPPKPAAPPPQQAAPPQQPPPAPPPQPQQQPPQAKQPPIMGLPAMQGPRKMAGGGIIAFNGEKDSEVPKDEEKATSSLGDFLRGLMEPPEFLKGRIERAKDIDYAESQVPSPITAVTPSERERRKAETARVFAGGKRPAESGSIPEAVKDDAKKDGSKTGETSKIIRTPNPTSGIPSLMQGMGGSRKPSREDDELRKRILAGEPMGPAQKAYMQNADRLASQFENAKAPSLSDADRDALETKLFDKYQTRSKPHFDMMQKLIDEEKASNEGRELRDIYSTLGKVGGSLMSARGAFGPAFGNAFNEGIDYKDKADAARIAADRLRRQAQMELLKARMADEKDDQKSVQAHLAERDRNLRDAYKIDQEGKVAALNARGKSADLEAGDQRGTERAINALALSDARREISDTKNFAANQIAMARLGAQSDAARLRGLPSISEYYKMQEQADAMFANPFQGKAAAYLSSVGPEGKNYISKVQMMGMKPQEALKDPGIAAAVEKAKAAYINDVLRSTNRVNASSSSVRDGNELFASLPK